jgi:hypothetical protein
MLKMKIHRLPVVDQDEQVIGESQNPDKPEIKKKTACIYLICIILNIDNSEHVTSLMGF